MVQNDFSDLKKDMVSKNEMREHQNIVLEEFRRLNADIKTTLGPTVVIVAEQEKRIRTLESRLGRVERKVGIKVGIAV